MVPAGGLRVWIHYCFGVALPWCGDVEYSQLRLYNVSSVQSGVVPPCFSWNDSGDSLDR